MTEKESIRSIVAQNVRKYRRQVGLTQEKLAELADISNTYIANIECGKTWISDKTLEKISAALRTDAYLFFIAPLPDDGSDSEKPAALHEEFKKIDEAKEQLCSYIQHFFNNEVKRLVLEREK